MVSRWTFWRGKARLTDIFDSRLSISKRGLELQEVRRLDRSRKAVQQVVVVNHFATC